MPRERKSLEGESPEELRAFNLYVKMGDARSHMAVATAMHRNRATINKWAAAHKWSERLSALQKEDTERAQEQIKEQYFADAEKLRAFKYTILDALKEKFETSHRCAGCKAHRLSVGEMISILNVTKTELGEPTAITKNTNPNPGNDPFAVILSRLFPGSDGVADAK